jgi:hypothetical protein
MGGKPDKKNLYHFISHCHLVLDNILFNRILMKNKITEKYR